MKYVRDSKRVWPYCSDCGCRLKPSTNEINRSELFLKHYEGFYLEEDARGCRCKMIKKGWFIPKSRVYKGVDF